MADESRNTGRDLIASVHQIARNQATDLEETRAIVVEQRITNASIQRVAELLAHIASASSAQHLDITEHIDSVPGIVLRMALAGKLTPSKPQSEGEGEAGAGLGLTIGKRRIAYLDHVAAKWAAKLLPWILAAISTMYTAAHELTAHHPAPTELPALAPPAAFEPKSP